LKQDVSFHVALDAEGLYHDAADQKHGHGMVHDERVTPDEGIDAEVTQTPV